VTSRISATGAASLSRSLQPSRPTRPNSHSHPVPRPGAIAAPTNAYVLAKKICAGRYTVSPLKESGVTVGATTRDAFPLRRADCFVSQRLNPKRQSFHVMYGGPLEWAHDRESGFGQRQKGSRRSVSIATP